MKRNQQRNNHIQKNNQLTKLFKKIKNWRKNLKIFKKKIKNYK